MTETATEATGSVPSDADLKAERLRATKAAALAKARAAKAEKAGKGGSTPPAEEKAPKVPTLTLSEAMLDAGCEALVTLLWLLTQGLCAVFKRPLPDLAPEDRERLAKEAVPLVKGWHPLAIILSFLGFPLGFVRTVKLYLAQARSPSQAPPTPRPS
jgi:hypothetical protein